MCNLCDQVSEMLNRMTEFPEKESEVLIKSDLGIGVSF